MVEARLDRPIYHRHVLALLLPSRIDAAGCRVTNSTCTKVCVYFDWISVVWGADFFLLLSKDTQSNTSSAPRRALSFMRNSRTVKRAYEALPLPIDPSKLSYHDSCRDHGQLPRWTPLHWTVRYNNAFFFSSYCDLPHWDFSFGVEECSGMFFETSKGAGHVIPLASYIHS